MTERETNVLRLRVVCCSVTNYFLVNLSFADLLVTLICMPMAVGQNVSKLWIYGEVMCMLTTYFQGWYSSPTFCACVFLWRCDGGPPAL